jgi:hypothetical protein
MRCDARGLRLQVSATTTRLVSLQTREARRSLRFVEARLASVPDKRLVVVEQVAVGSEAEKAGVKPGDIVLAVSDPVRAGLWQLADKASARTVRDTLRYRVGSSFEMELSGCDVDDLVVESEPVALPPDVSARRSARRQAYLDKVGRRNDSGFFSVLLLGILSVPLTILLVAWQNGFLLKDLT